MKPKRRSLLFVPAIKTKFYERALSSEADSVIFDLDDSVAPNGKVEAREVLRQHFPRNHAKEVSIRLNSAQSPFYADDVALMLELRPRSITLTKVEHAAEITQLVETFTGAGCHDFELILFIETLVGFYNLGEIVASSPHITAATLGTEDLCSEMGIERTPLAENPMLNRLTVELAMRCHQYNLQCLGPVFRGFGEAAQLQALEQECLYLKQLNAHGQFAIHPTQIAVQNRLFTITPEQIAAAEQTLALFMAKAAEEGTAVISQNGQMQDTPSTVKARKLLQYAREHGYVG